MQKCLTGTVIQTRGYRMNNKVSFGTYEAVCLTTLMMIAKVFYASLSVIIKAEGTAAWYGTIISCITSLIVFYLMYLLLKRFPGLDITQVFEAVLGKVAGKILNLLFCTYVLFYAAANLREFIEMIKAYNLPYTPPSILIFGFIAVASLIAYFGLEGVARISAIVFIPVISGIAIILVLSIPYYDVDYLKPYWGYGFQKTLETGFLRSSAYEEFFILAIFINSIHGLKVFKKAGIISIVLTGIIFAVSILCYLMSFLYSVGSENLSGLFQLSRIIYFNRYVQRLESIFLFTWVIASLIAVSVAFYTSIGIYSKAFKIDNHRPLIFPFAFLLFMGALIPKNISELIQIYIHFIRQYSLIITYTIPVLVLLIAVIFKKRGAVNDQKG